MIKAQTHFQQVAVEIVKKITKPDAEEKPAIQIRIKPKRQTNVKR
jgi:hypothetical protein